MASEFDLVERNGRLADPANAGETRDLLRSVWAVPRDTFIADDLPVLLAKLSRIPAPPASEN